MDVVSTESNAARHFLRRRRRQRDRSVVFDRRNARASHARGARQSRRAQWFLQHFLEARRAGALEALCETGDVMFVPHQASTPSSPPADGHPLTAPSKWWHTALNIGESIAVTQNYLAPSGVAAALEWMQSRPSHVSGTHLTGDELAARLCAAIAAKRPDLVPATRPPPKRASLFAAPSDAAARTFAFGFAAASASE